MGSKRDKLGNVAASLLESLYLISTFALDYISSKVRKFLLLLITFACVASQNLKV